MKNTRKPRPGRQRTRIDDLCSSGWLQIAVWLYNSSRAKSGSGPRGPGVAGDDRIFGPYSSYSPNGAYDPNDPDNSYSPYTSNNSYSPNRSYTSYSS